MLQLVSIASWEVGSPHTAAKYYIPRDEHFLFRPIETEGAGRMARGVVDLQLNLSQFECPLPQVKISSGARGCYPHHLIKGFSMIFQVSFFLSMHCHEGLGLRELRKGFEVIGMAMGAHNEVQVLGAETVLLQ